MPNKLDETKRIALMALLRTGIVDALLADGWTVRDVEELWDWIDNQ